MITVGMMAHMPDVTAGPNETNTATNAQAPDASARPKKRRRTKKVESLQEAQEKAEKAEKAQKRKENLHKRATDWQPFIDTCVESIAFRTKQQSAIKLIANEKNQVSPGAVFNYSWTRCECFGLQNCIRGTVDDLFKFVKTLVPSDSGALVGIALLRGMPDIVENSESTSVAREFIASATEILERLWPKWRSSDEDIRPSIKDFVGIDSKSSDKVSDVGPQVGEDTTDDDAESKKRREVESRLLVLRLWFARWLRQHSDIKYKFVFSPRPASLSSSPIGMTTDTGGMAAMARAFAIMLVAKELPDRVEAALPKEKEKLSEEQKLSDKNRETFSKEIISITQSMLQDKDKRRTRKTKSQMEHFIDYKRFENVGWRGTRNDRSETRRSKSAFDAFQFVCTLTGQEVRLCMAQAKTEFINRRDIMTTALLEPLTWYYLKEFGVAPSDAISALGYIATVLPFPLAAALLSSSPSLKFDDAEKKEHEEVLALIQDAMGEFQRRIQENQAVDLQTLDQRFRISSEGKSQFDRPPEWWMALVEKCRAKYEIVSNALLPKIRNLQSCKRQPCCSCGELVTDVAVADITSTSWLKSTTCSSCIKRGIYSFD